MTNVSSTRPERRTKSRWTRSAQRPVELPSKPGLIRVERSGDWMPADELRESALATISEGKDLTVDLNHIDHLDASALQILLAAQLEIKKVGHTLRVVKVSSRLRKWFELAGVDEHFCQTRVTKQ